MIGRTVTVTPRPARSLASPPQKCSIGHRAAHARTHHAKRQAKAERHRQPAHPGALQGGTGSECQQARVGGWRPSQRNCMPLLLHAARAYSHWLPSSLLLTLVFAKSSLAMMAAGMGVWRGACMRVVREGRGRGGGDPVCFCLASCSREGQGGSPSWAQLPPAACQAHPLRGR